MFVTFSPKFNIEEFIFPQFTTPSISPIRVILLILSDISPLIFPIVILWILGHEAIALTGISAEGAIMNSNLGHPENADIFINEQFFGMITFLSRCID